MAKGAHRVPNIKFSTDEISTFCHEHREPIFITKNGQGDLVVMSMETYDMLNGKLELYQVLDDGITAVREGRKRPFAEVMRDIRQAMADDKI